MNNRQKAKRFKLLYETCLTQKELRFPILTEIHKPVRIVSQMDFGRDEPNMEFVRSALIRGLMPEVMKYARISREPLD